MQRFNLGIHGARGLFAGMVFVFHVVNSGLPTLDPLRDPLLLFWLSSTEYGVELFFAISGFVMLGTLERAGSAQHFLRDRAVRIYPVLIASILFIVLVGRAAGNGTITRLTTDNPVRVVIENLLALPGVLPLPQLHPAAWSLSYEVAFYLICAFAWVGVAAHRRGTLAWAITGAMLLFSVWYPRALFFAGGIAIAQGWLAHGLMGRIARHPLLCLIVFLGAWRGVQALSPVHIIETTLIDWAGDWRIVLGMLGFAAGSLAVSGIAAGHGILPAMLRRRSMQYLGTISYSFYLWHPVVMAIVKAFMLRAGLIAAVGHWAQPLFLIISLPAALLVSHASQLLLEGRVSVWLRDRTGHTARPAPVAP